MLGLSKEEAVNFDKVRASYRKLMIDIAKIYGDKAKRVALNMAYIEACEIIFKQKESELTYWIMKGEVGLVEQKLKADKALINKKQSLYPPLYLAVRSGHYSMVELILSMGCEIKFSDEKSTPMHCASYYGHYSLIPLLLKYGMPIDIVNYAKNKPIDEAATKDIQSLLENANSN